MSEEDPRFNSSGERLDTRFTSDIKSQGKNLVFIKTCRNPKELILGVNKMLPGWIYDVLDSYDKDLTPLTDAWNDLCKRSGSKPQKIVLVEKVVYHSDRDAAEYKILLTALDFLTKHGFCVREKNEFTSCVTGGCNSALLAKEVRNQLYKSERCKRPFVNMCLNCLSNKNNMLL